MSNQMWPGGALRPWLLLLALPGLLSAGCDALWGGFLAYRSCDAQSACPQGQTCDLAEQRCKPTATDGGTEPPLGVAAGVCVLPNLCWENPLPQGNDLTAVSVRAPGDVWAVGPARTSLHLDGSTWKQAIPSTMLTHDTLAGVHALAGQGVWLVGGAGTAWYGDGTAWTARPVSGGGDLLGVFATAANTVFAVGDQHSLYGCINCAGWIELNIQTAGYLRGVWASGPASIWGVGDAGQIIHSTGTGTSAIESSGVTNPLNSVWGASASDVLAVGKNGVTLRRSGTSVWTVVNTGSMDELRGVWGVGTERWTTAVKGGGQGQILRLAGYRWEAASPMLPELNALSGNALGSGVPDLWAVGVKGTLVQGDGTSWTVRSSGLTADLLAIWGSSETDIWAGGEKGTLLHFDGQRWQATASPVSDDILAIHGTSAADVWLSTLRGTIMHFDGQAWQGAYMSQYRMPALWAASPQDVFVAAEQGTTALILRNKGGSGWAIADMPPASINALWGSGPNDIWAVGYVGTVRHWNGMLWGAGPSPGVMAQALAVTGVSASEVWLSTASGGVYRLNGGAWEQILVDGSRRLQALAGLSDMTVLALGAVPGGTPGYLSRVGRYVSTVLPTVVQRPLRGAWVSPKGKVWMVGEGGAILRYTP